MPIGCAEGLRDMQLSNSHFCHNFGMFIATAISPVSGSTSQIGRHQLGDCDIGSLIHKVGSVMVMVFHQCVCVLCCMETGQRKTREFSRTTTTQESLNLIPPPPRS